MSGTLFIADLLNSDTWRDMRGTVIPVSQLEHRHARNILGYLEKRVRFDIAFYEALHDLAAQIGEDGQMVDDPVAYVRSLPIYIAIKQHLEE